MSLPSPYSPDRSLLLAIGVLTGAVLLGAGGVYVISSLSVGSGGNGGSVARAGRSAPVPSGYFLKGSRSRGGSSPIAGGGVPAWAGSEGPAASTGRSVSESPQSSYDINPDFGHARLDGPSSSSENGGGGGVAIADAGRSNAVPGPSTSDLSERSFREVKTGRETQQWRSEAQALASRSRALSNALGRLDGAGSRTTDNSHAKEESRSPGEATTASGARHNTNSDPGTPGDPDQVPLGGTEWLAAAGAAYALNRLHKGGGEESEDDI